MASTTRLSSITKLIALVGPSKEFLPSEVPTLRAVIQRGILIQETNLHNNISRNQYPIREMAKELAQLILAQWQISNIDFQHPVTKHDKTIADIIVTKWEALREVSQKKANKKETENVMNCLDKLFDINTCQCIIYLWGSPRKTWLMTVFHFKITEFRSERKNMNTKCIFPTK